MHGKEDKKKIKNSGWFFVCNDKPNYVDLDKLNDKENQKNEAEVEKEEAALLVPTEKCNE